MSRGWRVSHSGQHMLFASRDEALEYRGRWQTVASPSSLSTVLRLARSTKI